jgi:trigger factor
MQVTVEEIQGLERKMVVTLPQKMVEAETQQKLRKLANEINIKGFRPGKVPVNVVKQRFGATVTQDALESIVNKTLPEALNEKKLSIVGTPQIEIHEGDDNEFSYTVVFETYPEIKQVSLDAISIEKPTAEITEDDIEHMIAALRQQRKTWAVVERVAQEGDRVTMDFVGKMNGLEFEDGSASNQILELGSGRFIAGFEQGLQGKMAGETTTLNLTFPENYHKAKLSGQPVEFTVTLQKVEQATLPKIDEAFIKSFEVEDGTLEAFRANIKDNMASQLASVVKDQVKKMVLEAVLAHNKIDAPNSMVDSEAKHLAKMTENDYRSRGQDIRLEPETFKAQALKRVQLGLLIGKIISNNKLEANPEKVLAHIENLASNYEEPESVVKWFYAQDDRLNEIKTQILEDDVVDWILTQITVNEKTSTFNDIVKPQSTYFA